MMDSMSVEAASGQVSYWVRRRLEGGTDPLTPGVNPDGLRESDPLGVQDAGLLEQRRA